MSTIGLLIIIISNESVAKCIDIHQPKETYFTLKPNTHMSLSKKKNLSDMDYVFSRTKFFGFMTNLERFKTGFVFVCTHKKGIR